MIKSRFENIQRQMVDVIERGEPLFRPDGKPTRKHLALVMWSYSPQPVRLAQYQGPLRIASTTAMDPISSR